MISVKSIAILGAGNIGTAIASGLGKAELISPEKIILSRRHVQLLDDYAKQGFTITSDNIEAVNKADIIILSVEPQHANQVMEQISSHLKPEKHILISIVSSLTISKIKEKIKCDVPIIRAMPNTAISIRESMTCIAAENRDIPALKSAIQIFNTVGQAIIIDEEQMSGATALGACGIAFFLRAIRAASQGGIEIGFHSEEALKIAAQTAKGAASLLASFDKHPEYEIDRVTTPRGCTITGLNQMEHDGFSSAMIKGIVMSAEKATKLYK